MSMTVCMYARVQNLQKYVRTCVCLCVLCVYVCGLRSTVAQAGKNMSHIAD